MGKREKESQDQKIPYNVSRRGFLKAASSIAVLTSISGIANSCTPRAFVGGVLWEEAPFDGIVPNQTFAYADVVPPPPEFISEDMLGFFTVDEANTVEALTATIMPGTPEDPGAREAGVIIFIDTYLSRNEFAWSEPTYQNPPFAETFEGPQPPQSSSPYQRIWVRSDQIDRYGFQSRLTPREIYRGGIISLNQYSMNRFGAKFADLNPQQQETVVGSLADGNVDTFSEPSADLFFDMVRQDVIYGMFADPAYGGNRDLVGWKLVGYPGVHRSYTPADMLSEDPPRELQRLEQLPAFNPGTGQGGSAVLPVSDANPVNQFVPDVPHRHP